MWSRVAQRAEMSLDAVPSMYDLAATGIGSRSANSMTSLVKMLTKKISRWTVRVIISTTNKLQIFKTIERITLILGSNGEQICQLNDVKNI